jgi:mannose-6-phosphate isomerase-like protein (cupin superfamily)
MRSPSACVFRVWQELGMIDEEESEVGSGDEGTPRKKRRPTRSRLAPLHWWSMQVPNYIRTETGIGATMPILDPARPVVQYSKSPVRVAKAKPPRRPTSKTPKPAAAAAPPASYPKGKIPEALLAQARAQIEAQDSLATDPLPTYITILDSEGREVQVQTLAKNTRDIQLESLGGPDRVGGHPMPHGGKAFEQPEFSSGVLSLPPRAKKQREVANNNEVFYVISGPQNGLTMTLHTQTMKLSPGSQFMIPAGNTYELHNTSIKDTIRLMFVLVKPAALWIAESREQIEAEQQRAAVEAEQEEEEAEEEEEEEEEKPRRSKGTKSSKRK